MVCFIVGGDGVVGGEIGEYFVVGVVIWFDGGGFGSCLGWVVLWLVLWVVVGVGNCVIDIGGICWCGS